jgi:hypothetical protein
MEKDKTSSEFTDETKLYISGGTTPDSDIVVARPKRSHFKLVVVGAVGVYLAYLVFFNKKSI